VGKVFSDSPKEDPLYRKRKSQQVPLEIEGPPILRSREDLIEIPPSPPAAREQPTAPLTTQQDLVLPSSSAPAGEEAFNRFLFDSLDDAQRGELSTTIKKKFSNVWKTEVSTSKEQFFPGWKGATSNQRADLINPQIENFLFQKVLNSEETVLASQLQELFNAKQGYCWYTRIYQEFRDGIPWDAPKNR